MTEPVRIVLLTSRPWNEELAPRLAAALGAEVRLVTHPAQLTVELLRTFEPHWVLAPHWSSIIPAEIYAAFRVVIFHMTDLPYGRGGSPLQNLIVAGHAETVICALHCEAGLDTGPVYLRAPLSLEGSAREIFLRAREVIFEMAVRLVREDPTPTPQVGEPVHFRRRRPADGVINALDTVDQVYDFIRMLDCDGYPPATMVGPGWVASLSEARRDGDAVEARVVFRPRLGGGGAPR
jgi:methionyl-tRNA formyltransferase